MLFWNTLPLKRMQSNTKLKSQYFAIIKRVVVYAVSLVHRKNTEWEEKVVSSHKCDLIKNVVEIIWLTFLSVLKKSECMEKVQERLDSVLTVSLLSHIQEKVKKQLK